MYNASNSYYYWTFDCFDSIFCFLVKQKGFPLETTLDEILEWTNGKGQAENIQMRRNLQRQFKVNIENGVFAVLCYYAMRGL